MKKIKLLLAAVAAMVGLSANAQSWTSPGSDPVSGQSYYILNVGAGQFVTAANDWGTQLSATGTDGGLLIKTNTVSNIPVGGVSLSGWELLNTNNNDKLLFRDSERWGYTDRNNQDRGYVWTITKVNGVYRLQTAAGDPAYPAASTQYAGANANLNGARVYFGYNSSSNDIDWIFLTEAQKGTANIVAKARLYRALMKAYAAGVNTEDASAVYENSSSTAEDMNSAVTALNNACLAAHLDNASDADPRDITEFVLSNSDFTKGDINGWETNYVSGTQATNIGYQDNNTYQSANGFVSKFIEAWRSGNAKIGDGYLRQTVSDMPEGKYVLECDAIATNQGNTSATTTGALLFINADGVDFTTSLSTNGSAVQHFSTEFLFSGEGNVIFGLKTQSTTANWIAADNFKVTYYGIDLSAYETQLAAAVAAFEALEGTVPTTTYTNKKTTVVDANNITWNSSKEYSTAISAIQAATSELSTLASAYAEYNTIRAAVLAAYASTDVTAADAAANSASSVEDINTAIATVRTALKDAIVANNAENINLTAALLTNPSFETGDLTGWTNTGMSVQGNESFGKDGSYYVECWQPNGTKSITQVLTGMPAGVYKATATIKARGVSSATLSAGGVSKAMTIGDEQNTYIVEFACDENADVTIKFEGVGTNASNSWLCADNFTLTYVGSLPELTAVEGKMNADVATAQTNAINAYNSDKTVANYNAASAAIAAAETSKAAYAKAATALADAKTLGTNFNFATTAATTTFTEAVATVETAYNTGTLTDANANNGANLGTVVVGWHAARSSENFTIAEAYMQSAWTGGELNDWSIEGDSDGSNFHVPFFQNWIADANSLAEGTTSGQLTGLENGLYEVSAWVRVRIKNGQEAGTVPSGITLAVNNGTAVNACAGTQIGETQFYLATITAEGLVKDGTLNAVFTRSAENNVSWLSFKNITYTKVRDLTPEEAAVVPTAIALDETEVALDATTTSKTFTLTFTPENATETVTWTTSDASVATVADGVVTAVSTGTATITATSTLDNSVSATATVTVDFPETTVPSSYYLNDGATRTVYTTGENLIKNGTFEYPDGFYGWTDATAGAAKLTSSKFDIVTDGDTKYLKAKASEGSTAAGSIGTAWPIEAGKTYVFGYRVKANQTIGDKSKYHKLTLTNTLGTETTQVSDDNTPVTASWSNVQYTFTNTDGYAYVQFRARWLANDMSFDDFYLAEVTSTTEGNVEYATAAIPTANIGTGAFQYSQNAIAATNALVQGTATVEDVTNAYNALQVLNAPASDEVFNIVMGDLTWTNNNNATMLSTRGKAVTYYAGGRNDGGGYTSQFDKEPNKNLAQAFYFTPAEGVNKYKVYQIDADGNQRYLCTGVVYGGNANQVRTTTEANSAEVYTITATATDGVYNFTNASGINLGAQDAGLYGTNRNNNLLIVKTEKPSITINTTAAGWGTTILPFAVSSLPEGVKAYTCAETNGATLTLVEVDALEANKPYIIEGVWNETLTGDAQGTALTYKVGLLTGVYSDTDAPNGSYVLQKNNDKVGFYEVNTEHATPIVRANRAYLEDEAPAGGAKFAAFFFDRTTAINDIFNGLQDGEAYDLAGRKVQKLQKNSVYIINGRKVAVK